MITPDLFLQALKRGAEPCEGEAGCIHEVAMTAHTKTMEGEIEKCLRYALSSGVSPSMMIFSAGIHIGYRLAQLEVAPAPATVN